MYEWTTVTVDVKARFAAQEIHEFLDQHIRDAVEEPLPESYYKNDGRIVIRMNSRHVDAARDAVNQAQKQHGEVFRAAVLCGNDASDSVKTLYVYDWLADKESWFEPITDYDDRTTGRDVFAETMTEELGWVPETGYWTDGQMKEGFAVVSERLRKALDDRSRLKEETENILYPVDQPDDWESPLAENEE